MRSTRWITTAAIAAVTVAIAIAATSPAAPSRATTLRFDSKFSAFHATDVDPKGASAGDSQQVADVLSRGGSKRGQDRLNCVHTDAKYFECDWTLLLPHGTIQMSGLGHDTDRPYTIAVVGGTGRYASARGTMTITDSTKSVAHYLVRLR